MVALTSRQRYGQVSSATKVEGGVSRRVSRGVSYPRFRIEFWIVFAFMRACQNGVWCNPEHGVNGASVTKAAEAAQSEAVEKKDFEPQNIDAHCAHVS